MPGKLITIAMLAACNVAQNTEPPTMLPDAEIVLCTPGAEGCDAPSSLTTENDDNAAAAVAANATDNGVANDGAFTVAASSFVA